jgi:RPA family protein
MTTEYLDTTQLFNEASVRLEDVKLIQPNVYNLWKVYLYKKHNAYVKSVNECLTMLNEIDNINKPLTISDLQTLAILRRESM